MSAMEIRSPRAPVFGRRGMVVSGHATASLAGIDALRHGGTIVDAMIAASAVLAVVLGHATSIGGDCFILFHQANSGTVGLNASGIAPAAATPERFHDGMKTRGPLAPVVPGLVRAWEAMHRRYGRLGWRELFDAAIDLAENGHPVSQVLADRIPDNRDLLAADPGCAALYLPHSKPIEAGHLFRQPALARTLEAIAAAGADGFHRGDTARRIAAFFRARGGLITADDLAAAEPIWVEPAVATYRGHQVSVMPPNSFGILLLMQLEGLAALSSEALISDPARTVGAQMSAMKAAFELGRPLIADPREVPDAVERALSPDMCARLRAAVLARARDVAVPNRGGTSCLMLADHEGNAICVVQSVFNVFGSAFLDPATGVLFNNRMQGFSHLAGQPNSVAPLKRPAHTLCPVMVHRNGRLRYLLASPGGVAQTLTNAQLLTHLIDRGADVAAAVEAPRWTAGDSGKFLIESEFPATILPALAAQGHQVTRAPDPYFYGSAKAIEFLPSGTLAGAGDHRREAFALGY